MSTEIQWTDETWNPVTGCSKVSPGCAHCYAEGVANRFWPKKYAHQGDGFVLAANVRLDAKLTGRVRQFTDVMCHEDRLDQPLRWKKPRKVFVNSMSDLFHEDVPDAFIDRVFAVMALAYPHTFQILTKRPERMRAYLTAHDVGLRWLAAIYRNHGGHPNTDDQAYQEGDAVRWTREGLPNVWLGVSVENQRFADERIPLLLQTPAAVRFISAEPLLGSVDLARGGWSFLEPLRPPPGNKRGHERGLDWVIVGGESGRGARPFDVAWARAIVAQGQAAGVPVFVKQLGAKPTGWWSNSLGPRVGTFKDSHGGDMAEWPEDIRVREFPR